MPAVNLKNLIASVIHELGPLVVEQVNEDRKRQISHKYGEIDVQQAQGQLKIFNKYASLDDESEPNQQQMMMMEEPVHNHGSDDSETDCPTCSRVDFLRRGSSTPTPHAHAGGKDPHYDYTVRELAKHLGLLQNHFTNYRCQNCIRKHLLVIEGLAEEGVPMTKDPSERQRFQDIINWSKTSAGRKDWDKLLEEARETRNQLTGMQHVAPETSTATGETEHDHDDHDHSDDEN